MFAVHSLPKRNAPIPKAGLLTYRSTLVRLPSHSMRGTVAIAPRSSLLTVAGPRGIFTRFPFHSPFTANTLSATSVAHSPKPRYGTWSQAKEDEMPLPFGVTCQMMESGGYAPPWVSKPKQKLRVPEMVTERSLGLCVGEPWTYVQASRLKVHGTACFCRFSNSPTRITRAVCGGAPQTFLPFVRLRRCY